MIVMFFNDSMFCYLYLLEYNAKMCWNSGHNCGFVKYVGGWCVPNGSWHEIRVVYFLYVSCNMAIGVRSIRETVLLRKT